MDSFFSKGGQKKKSLEGDNLNNGAPGTKVAASEKPKFTPWVEK